MTPAPAFPVERDVVAVSGPDAARYLHSQLSQAVDAMAVGEVRWSFLLQPTGKVDALVRVVRTGDDAFELDTDLGWGDATVARLNRFRIRVKADVTGPHRRAYIVRYLPGAPAVLAPAAPAAAAGAFHAHEAHEAAAVREAARIDAGWPAMGAELTEATIPAESGIIEHAISFTKGCYPGQELVERVDSRGGNVPRHLHRLAVAGPAGPGDALVAAGRVVGVLTSVAGGVALGYLQRSAGDASAFTTPAGATVTLR